MTEDEYTNQVNYNQTIVIYLFVVCLFANRVNSWQMPAESECIILIEKRLKTEEEDI